MLCYFTPSYQYYGLDIRDTSVISELDYSHINDVIISVRDLIVDIEDYQTIIILAMYIYRH